MWACAVCECVVGVFGVVLVCVVVRCCVCCVWLCVVVVCRTHSQDQGIHMHVDVHVGVTLFLLIFS